MGLWRAFPACSATGSERELDGANTRQGREHRPGVFGRNAGRCGDLVRGAMAIGAAAPPDLS